MTGRPAVVWIAVVLLFAACTPADQPDDQDRRTTSPTAAEVTPPPDDEPEPGRGKWEPGADAPVRLSEVGAAAFDDRIWTAGGLTGDGDASTAVLSYDPESDSWDTGPDLPGGIHHATLVGGDRLYAIGGYVGSGFGTVSGDVWILDSAGQAWTKGPELPEGRAAGAGAWDGARVVYGGGVGPRGDLSDAVFALVGGQWERVGELSRAREHLGAAGDGAGQVWFLGGRAGGLDANLADVDLVAGDTVTRIGSVPTARGGVAGFHAPGIGACLAGGESPSGTFAEVECVDSAGGTTTLPSLNQARHGLGAAVVGDAAYTLLGGARPGLDVSGTVERLDLP